MSKVEPTLYDILGEEGFAALVAGFYRRVKEDDLLAPMYPEDDWEGAEVRLRDFLVGRFGGPPRYIESRGHPRLRVRHRPFPIDQAARDRWMALMEASMADCVRDDTIPAMLGEGLLQFLGQVATFMIHRR